VQTIVDELKTVGIHLAVDGENLVFSGKRDALTKDMLAVVRQHKPALIELLTCTTLADVTNEPLPPTDDPPPYIHRCPRCNGTRWGCIRTEVETLGCGQTREFEVWGCLDCSPLTPGLDDITVPEGVGDTTQCPECDGSNIVIIADRVDVVPQRSSSN
jgi:hypothetical protein